MPDGINQSQFSFNNGENQLDNRYDSIDVVGQQEPDDLQYQSFLSNQLSVEPEDNEQSTENPFMNPMQNRTGSIESNTGFVDTGRKVS